MRFGVETFMVGEGDATLRRILFRSAVNGDLRVGEWSMMNDPFLIVED